MPTQTCLLVRGLPVLWRKEAPSSLEAKSDAHAWADEHSSRLDTCAWYAAARGGRALVDILCMLIALLAAARHVTRPHAPAAACRR